MAIRFQCLSCNQISSVHERMHGREVKCPSCQVPILIPEPSSDEDEPDEDWLGVDRPVEAEVFRESVAQEDAPREDFTVKKVTFAKKELPKDDMDMTPMVDVTFLLLIFFMITASFTTEKALQQQASTDQPSTQAPQEESDTIKILIDEFNAYTVIFPDGGESEATSKQELISVLKLAELDGSSEDASSLVIEAHEDSVHAAVVGALDAGRQNKLTKFKVNVVDGFD